MLHVQLHLFIFRGTYLFNFSSFVTIKSCTEKSDQTEIMSSIGFGYSNTTSSRHNGLTRT